MTLSLAMQDDVLYVCSLIEFVARQTKNTVSAIATYLGHVGVQEQLEHAQVNHCLSFEEIAHEVIEDYQVQIGDFDAVGLCQYEVPTETAIGGVYRDLIVELVDTQQKPLVSTILEVLTSPMSDAISDFNSSTFYENPSYIYHSYLAGELLD